MPRSVIAGNWKMHHGPEETRAFFESFDPPETGRETEVLFFPPALSVPAAVAAARRRGWGVGVQNIHWEDAGAYTGEISGAMAREAGAGHALVGHSERRHVFGETDEEVTRKVAAALRHGLVPVVCVGETYDERKAGRVDEVILRQLDAALEGLGEGGAMILAYEPVWAIGTGETATPEDASSAHGTLRGHLAAVRGPDVAGATPILYGGSVKPHNAADLLDAPDVDGVLVGGASLEADSFAAIVGAAAR